MPKLPSLLWATLSEAERTTVGFPFKVAALTGTETKESFKNLFSSEKTPWTSAALLIPISKFKCGGHSSFQEDQCLLMLDLKYCANCHNLDLVMLVAPFSKLSSDLYPGYSLCQFLGNGGFGEVWSAQTDKGEPVALKFLSCGRRRTSLQELRSIQVVLHLRHPHLVRIERVWAASEYLVVAMELADGSLDDLLEIYQTEVGKPIPAEDLLPLLAQAADALDFLNTRRHKVRGHLVGIQHCDISPGNLLIFDQTVKLSDFSLTTAFQGKAKDRLPAGKPAYAAPEIFRGQLSNHTDQYALAVMYCKLRTGQLPFPDTPDTFEPTYTRSVPDLSMLTRAERSAIERALAVRPNDRWNSCSELVAQLIRQTAATRASHQTSSSGERRKHARHRGSQEASCRLLLTRGKTADTVKIRDISRGGIRLLVCGSNFPGEAGTTLSLALANKARGHLRVARMSILRKSVLPGGDCVLAGKFESQLSAQDLGALVDERCSAACTPGCAS
jgi:serine/threonine protein kinase, bacterial